VKLVDLKTKSVDELKNLVLLYKKELMNLRFQKTAGSLTNTSRFKIVRKTIAKIKTLINNVHLLSNGGK
jgi:large subunit ribosomal protein L29